ncbi:Maf family protein [Polynucleobacter kasalickyi]|uniref:dTTP/UTP pyrophosphatase n=1 Tax=Polynucleobacter kasalickyi TaxID=1938817 RepID=A0A1W1ZMK2_9BURK|nr:septum formation protein [Polynucleobacter kasalickyi]
MSKLYLASQSPRRAQILTDLGVQFEILQPDPNEDTEALEEEQIGELGIDYVKRVTLAKLDAAVRRLSQRVEFSWQPILCADTTVCMRDQQTSWLNIRDLILGKPRDEHHALEMLTLLNGKFHWVHTAIALQKDPQSDPIVKICSTQVHFANNSPERLAAYVKTKEPMGKAGGYGIQGLGSALIDRIEGSYSGVMGLPIHETTQLLDYAKIPFIL